MVGKIVRGVKLVNRLERIYREGRDVYEALAFMREHHKELPVHLCEAWKQIDEFCDAVLGK